MFADNPAVYMWSTVVIAGLLVLFTLNILRNRRAAKQPPPPSADDGMGTLTVTIRREGQEIPLEDWKELAENDPELVWCDVLETVNPATGETLRAVPPPGYVLFQPDGGQVLGAFCWEKGRVRADRANGKTLQKARALAAVLHAATAITDESDSVA